MVYVIGAQPVFRMGPTNQDATKQPDPVSATSPYSFTSVLGRQIPIVIGTGKVDGNPVVGGSKTSRVITGYTQYPHTAAGALAAGGSGFDSALDSFPPGSKFTTGDAFSPTVDVPVYGTSVGAQIGYLLAYDPFNLGYILVRLEVNDEVVYDAENGIGATTTFRFYGGQHTAIDPIAQSAIGADAGAWQNFAMVYLDGFSASSPPTVKAVISNASSVAGGTTPIPWTGTVPGTFGDISGWLEAYDPVDNVIYHLLTSQDIPGLTTVNLAVLDTQTLTERYRIPLANSDLYAAPDPSTHVLQRPSITSIRGTGHVLIRFSTDSTVGVSRIYNATTGDVVAEYVEPDTSTTIYWVAGQAFGSKYIFIGYNRYFSSDQHIHFAVADIGGASLTVTSSSVAFREPAVWGRRIDGKASFFSCSTTVGEVYELTFDGTSWASNLVYTDAGTVHGLRYDPKTGYLIVCSQVSSNYFLRYINPDTGAIITSFSTGGKRLISNSDDGLGGYERFWSQPGFALWVYAHGSSEDVLLLDVAAQTLSTWSGAVPHGTLWIGAIFDQTRGVYYSFYGDTKWTQYALPNALPGSISLQSLITKTMFLARYSSGELTFDGFTGLTAYGFVIDQDTNVRTVLQSIADIYTVSFADTGDGFYFKKPGRDADFALDDTLTTADIVFVDKDGSVKSQDDASIRTVSRVELQYISKNQGYNSRPASFAMPAINNSIRTERYSTPLVLTDHDAQTFVTEKFFDLQAKRRSHAFSVTGKPTYLPGDVIAVPSGDITYTVQIDSVGMDRNLTAEIAALDFQTKVSTTVTSVTAPDITPVSQATQYIHLDIPLINYADDLNGVALCQYGILAGRGQANWSGGVLLMGATAEALTQAFTQAPHQGVVGVCLDVLANPLDPFGTGDTSTVTIRRTAGSTSLLVDHTEDEVLDGANLAFIGKAGRWEGIGYKTVEDNGDGTFTLSGLAVRGYRGSEVNCALHEIGDIFVMIDPSWVGIMALPLADLSTTMYFEGVGTGQNPAGGVITPQLIRGIAEKPYASRNLDAAVVTDGIEITWDYRSRLATGLNPANFGEASLAFEIDILEPTTDGLSVVRTLTASTNSKLYTNADIASDFGSVPDELTFDVYMMSATTGVGRGYRARRYVVFSPGAMTADNSIITADSTAYTADAA
jgi:hypothetical protein